MAVVLITGGNSGFGLAGIRAFSLNGDQVVATVRNEQRREALRALLANEGLQAELRLLELTDSATISACVDDIVRDFGRIDVLVNNAGIVRPGACEDLREEAIRELMEVNFMAPMFLARAVLPQMRSQHSGLIIMVSSLSGVAGLAGDVFYSASKFALEGATEALRHEVDRFGVRVALIEAAQYATELFTNACDENLAMSNSYPKDSPYRALVEATLKEVARGMSDAGNPQMVGDLMLTIAQSESSQLRWQADDLSKMVLSSLHKLSDQERDEFLRGASGKDWWSEGRSAPTENER